MKRCLSWFLVPLLAGVAIGLLLQARSANACRPASVFWGIDKAEAQPDASAADAALWPGSGLLAPGSLALQEGGVWLRLEY